MGISIVLSGLVSKHVELQTSLRELEDAADRAEDELAHIAKTIQIIDPDYPVDGLRPKRRRQRRIHSDGGNLKRHVGAFISAVTADFTTAEIRDALLAQGMVSTKQADMAYLTLRLSIHLKQLAALGVIKEVARLRKSESVVWRRRY